MAVHTNSLTKCYGRLVALDNCSLTIERGEVFGLLGPNGAGKTTLLRLLLGFLRPTHGTATVDGLDCRTQSLAVRARVAYLPGEARLFRHMRGCDVLKFFSRIRSGDRLQRSIELAERLELDLSRRVATMSTGMRQKLALAVTLAVDAPILILDEPTSNLDPTVRGDVMAMVRETQRAGRTVIFSSHVLSEVEEVCDRVVILRSGQVVHTQVMSQLRRQHRIHAQLAGPLPEVPERLAGQLAIAQHEPTPGDTSRPRAVTIETPGELSPLLDWLARLPMTEVRIEPVGLRAVYDRYHHNGRMP